VSKSEIARRMQASQKVPKPLILER
jgi:hypothetical protein